jgi:homoserine O-acetyltransferase
MTSSEPQVFDLRLPELRLEAGAKVDPLVLRGWWWGPDADLPRLRALKLTPAPLAGRYTYEVVQRSRAELAAVPATEVALDPAIPTILAIHALTGDMRVGGAGGWWEPMVGVGRAFDPRKARLLCFNNLGSCYGTSGPADEGFPLRDARLPAPISPWDQARAILTALDALGIRKVALATGGSLGGMIALCLAALDPGRFERIAPIAACGAASAWIIGWNHIGRSAILMDPGFPEHAERGLELARQVAMLTYRAEAGLDERHGRGMAEVPGWQPPALYKVETYLEHQGKKLRSRFHPLAYLAQLDAMDHHDLGREPGSKSSGGTWGQDRLRASTLAVDIATDQLYFPEQMRRLAAELKQRGTVVENFTIQSPHGHDAFLIEWDQVAKLLGRALALPAGA